VQLNRRTLRTLARRAGSAKALAESLGVHPSTLYRWGKKGLPKRGAALDAFRKFAIEFQSSDNLSSDFLDLKRLSEQYNSENMSLPKGKREPFQLPAKRSKIQKNREGRKTVAYINNKVWNVKLTPKSLLELIWWFEKETKSIRNSRPVWQLGFTASSFSPYGNANIYEGRTGPIMWVHQLPHPQADSFVILYTVASSRYSRKEDAIKDISRRMEQELNTLPPKEVLIRTTFVNNWRYRTPEEIRQRDTEKRYERKKKSKKPKLRKT
jgi:hypothetical protein